MIPHYWTAEALPLFVRRIQLSTWIGAILAQLGQIVVVLSHQYW
jgi:hypothetical protein